MSLDWKMSLFLIAAFVPFFTPQALNKSFSEIAQLLGYWTSLAMVYVTWSYVDATRSMLEEMSTQANAAQEQAIAARAQIEATEANLKAAERDREERFKPVLVPITDIKMLAMKIETRATHSSAPIAISNVGNAVAINISATVECLSCGTEPAQPFIRPSLAAGDTVLLGYLTNIGGNSVETMFSAAVYKIQCSDIIGTKYEFECRNGVVTQRQKQS